ncbi:hypothetical protein [Achromobacter spanius]
MNTEWKPIASAPKDGSSILGWGPQQDRVVIAWNEWARPEPGWEAVGLEVNGFECPKIVLRGEPTLWQSLPVEPCMTCGGHGMIGGLTQHSGYDAEQCPDCSPPAPTSHPIPTGATGEDGGAKNGQAGGPVDVLEIARETGLRSYFHGVNAMEARVILQRFVDALPVVAAPAAGDALDSKPDWVACESRRPWVTNSLKASAQKLRGKESRCRTAYTKDFYGIPARYVADAYAEAAAVFESKLAAIAQQKGEA